MPGQGERELVLHGTGAIRERLAGLDFRLSARSFFQTNTAQAERLLEIVREEVATRTGDVLFDVYCGAGVLGLALASGVRERGLPARVLHPIEILDAAYSRVV